MSVMLTGYNPFSGPALNFTKKKPTPAKPKTPKAPAKKEYALPTVNEWIRALRSGKYRKTRSTLCRLPDGVIADADHTPDRTKDRFCCLGVLCDLIERRHPELHNQIDWSSGSLPHTLAKAYGLDTENPSGPGDFADILTELNDDVTQKRGFKYISDKIEKMFAKSMRTVRPTIKV